MSNEWKSGILQVNLSPLLKPSSSELPWVLLLILTVAYPNELPG